MAAMTGNAIREALEPFAKEAEDWLDTIPDHVQMSAFNITLGDLRRARTAYDAIGSGVRTLAWKNGVDGIPYAGSPVGTYHMSPASRGRFRLYLGDVGFGYHLSIAETQIAAQADFERRVLSCLSTVAVEEADAKAVGPWHGMASAPRDGTYILASGLDFGTGPRRHFTVCLCLEGTDTFVEAEGGEELTYLAAWVPLPGAALLSTHTAAGAGPVGEPVGFQLFLSQLSSWGSILYSKEQAERMLAQDTHVPAMRPVYARPVEEPGEVERLTRERDEAQTRALASETNSELLQSELADAIRRGEDQWAGWVQEQVVRKAAVVRAETAESQLTTAEAALAETRERLEKVADGNRPLPYGRDELGRFVRDAWIRWAQTQPNPKPSWLLAYDELPEPDKEADRQIGEAIARWTLIGDAARAALTGDAQEAGK